MQLFPTSLTRWVKGELKIAIALGVLLVALVSFGLAAEPPKYKFDFGDGAAGSLASGYLPVDGAQSNFPVVSGTMQYGWLDEALSFSNGAAVTNLLNRDGNKGVLPARFKMAGIDNGKYTVSIASGSLDNSFTTQVLVDGRSYSTVSQPNQWSTLTFAAEVTGGQLELTFQRAGAGSVLWAVNSLTLTPTAAEIPVPTFDVTVQPNSHTVRVGGTAVYRVSVSPLNGYASQIDLSLVGLVGGISAQLTPAAALPPLTSDLTIVTAKTTPITSYEFVITAKGKDVSAYTVNKSITLVVTDSTRAPMTVQPGTTRGGVEETTPSEGGTETGTLDDVYLTPRTLAEARKEQTMVDKYAAEEAEKLADSKEILDIKEIPSINAAPAEPPKTPETALEASLQYLTAAGIIGTAVDTAPPAPAAAPPAKLGFWARLFRTMVNPTL